MASTYTSPRSIGFAIFRGASLTATLLLSFIVAAGLAGLTGAPQEGAFASLIVVSLVTSLVLAYPIYRSRWHGLRLVGTVFLVFFGAETFMSQIEAAFFGTALGISADEIMRIILSGGLRALFFSPLAVLILGKMRSPKVGQQK